MKKCLYILIILLSVNSNAFSQEKTAGGIIYGKDWAYFVSAPDKWIMDSTSLAGHNIYALFYEKGKVFSNKIPLIYINAVELKNSSDDEMEKLIGSDLEDFNAEGVTTRKIDLNNLEIEDTYFIYEIDNINGKYETVIYRRYNNACFIIVLNAPDKKTRKNLYIKMKQIIESMVFMDKK